MFYIPIPSASLCVVSILLPNIKTSKGKVFSSFNSLSLVAYFQQYDTGVPKKTGITKCLMSQNFAIIYK